MPLELLTLLNCRNLKTFTLKPHAHFTIIFGSNGVGKTTILESIYLLLRSKTFRSNKYKSFITHEENSCTVFSKFSSYKTEHYDDSFSIGIRRSKNSSQPELHLNTQKIHSLSKITRLVVLGLITPESFSLLDCGPSIRRKFIDWGVFHVEHSFLDDWRAYKKIILNRNNLLSNFSKNYKLTRTISVQNIEQINCWNHQLIRLNNKLDAYRSKQMESITHYFKQYLILFSTTLAEDIHLSFYQGWTQGVLYENYLNEKLTEDLLAGYTRYGTHRSDLKITLNHHLAKDILSRGQKKIVIICLILSQFRFLIEQHSSGEHHLLLLDDIDSELDEKNLNILFDLLKTFHCQILATTTNEQRYCFLNESDHTMFHVEHY